MLSGTYHERMKEISCFDEVVFLFDTIALDFWIEPEKDFSFRNFQGQNIRLNDFPEIFASKLYSSIIFVDFDDDLTECRSIFCISRQSAS